MPTQELPGESGNPRDPFVRPSYDVRVDLFPGPQPTFQVAVGRSTDAAGAMRRPAGLARPKLGP